ncbi:MAG: rhombosortase, partial [Gammaproteobacteria bacterium]
MNTVRTVFIHRYWLWWLLFGLCLLLQGLDLAKPLRFDRDLIAQGHLWLVISGHLVHLNWHHFWLNMAGLLLVAIFFHGYCSTGMWLLQLLWSALLVSLGLYVLNPELSAYVGLSGVLHGLFIVGAWYEARRHPLSGWVLLLLLVVKLVWEQLSGALPGSEAMTGGHVVVDAHLYGAISGGLFALLHQIIHVDDRQQNRQ